MTKILILFALVLMTISSGNLLQPRDLTDEAQKQLDQLRSIVLGDIMAAHDNLDSLIVEFKIEQLHVISLAALSMKQNQDKIDIQLDSMINLAVANGHDVSSCSNRREEILNKLPDRYHEQIESCIQVVDEGAVKAAQDARYVVDIVMNKVHDLENKLDRCREDILCISPLITEIELNKIRMPQNIKTEVQATESLLTTIYLSVKNCADSNVSGYIVESYNLYVDIANCLNKLWPSII